MSLDEVHRELAALGEPRVARYALDQPPLEMPRVGRFAVHLDALISQLASQVMPDFAAVIQMIDLVKGEQY
jgi:hypothetical protein